MGEKQVELPREGRIGRNDKVEEEKTLLRVDGLRETWIVRI